MWIDRKDTAKAVKSMEAACESLKQRPRSVLIFPEGTRTPTGELQEFKKGGFVLAIQARQRPASWPAASVALPRTGVHARADTTTARLGASASCACGKGTRRVRLVRRDRRDVSTLYGREGGWAWGRPLTAVAAQAGVPVVPVCVCGTYDVVVKGGRKVAPRPLKVRAPPENRHSVGEYAATSK